eukprot:SAG22_NODE_595_length_8730_cov_4.200672_8_plen_195_part_00
MGYNSWYDLTCSKAMNESTLRATTDAMVSKGLLKLGYNYMNLVLQPHLARHARSALVLQPLAHPPVPPQDDCYIKSRAADGTLTPDPVTFPSGMKALGDYVHSKNMKFGVCKCFLDLCVLLSVLRGALLTLGSITFRHRPRHRDLREAPLGRGPRGPGRQDLRLLGGGLPEGGQVSTRAILSFAGPPQLPLHSY